ncbi:glycosyltransferase [Methylobacterium sp. P31]
MLAGRGGSPTRLVAKIESHPFLGTRLFWFSDVDDIALERLYRQSLGLIAASYAEGYGLPLVEAAKRGVPIFARDIPVFREVAGSRATYFDRSGANLVRELRAWLDSLRDNAAIRPEGIPVLSWAQSTAQLLSIIREKK